MSVWTHTLALAVLHLFCLDLHLLSQSHLCHSRRHKCESWVSEDVWRATTCRDRPAAVAIAISQTDKWESCRCRTKIQTIVCHRAFSFLFSFCCNTSITSTLPHRADKESGSSSWDKRPWSQAWTHTHTHTHTPTYTRAPRVSCHTAIINSCLSAGSPYRIGPPEGDSFPMTDKSSLGDIEDP